jgi:hypothetical protein
MAVRAEHFRRGHRFDERIGPDGTSTYAMGGETELTLRLAITEGVACWHCKAARVQAIIPAQIRRGLAGATRDWALGSIRRDARTVFRGRWELNLWTGRLAEAIVSSPGRWRTS